MMQPSTYIFNEAKATVQQIEKFFDFYEKKVGEKFLLNHFINVDFGVVHFIYAMKYLDKIYKTSKNSEKEKIRAKIRNTLNSSSDVKVNEHYQFILMSVLLQIAGICADDMCFECDEIAKYCKANPKEFGAFQEQVLKALNYKISLTEKEYAHYEEILDN